MINKEDYICNKCHKEVGTMFEMKQLNRWYCQKCYDKYWEEEDKKKGKNNDIEK